MKKTNLIALAALVFAAPAFAQDEIATLQVEAGTVMTSTGGEFQTAMTGEAVAAGERVMVAEDSSVLVRYDGKDCVLRFAQPGVHVVPAGCQPGIAGAMTSGTAAGVGTVATTTGAFAGAGGAIGIVAGAVAATAAGMESAGDDGDPVPPISP